MNTKAKQAAATIVAVKPKRRLDSEVRRCGRHVLGHDFRMADDDPSVDECSRCKVRRH